MVVGSRHLQGRPTGRLCTKQTSSPPLKLTGRVPTGSHWPRGHLKPHKGRAFRIVGRLRVVSSLYLSTRPGVGTSALAVVDVPTRPCAHRLADMDGALLVSVAGVVLAVAAVLVANHARLDAKRSADAAEVSAAEARSSGHLSRAPDLTLTSSGAVSIGVPLDLVSSKDLDSIQVELATSNPHSPDLHELFINRTEIFGAEPVETGKQFGGWLIPKVEAGSTYRLYGQRVHGAFPTQMNVTLRCTCTLGDETWICTASTGPIDLTHRL